jgi:adenylate cyclase
VTVAILGSSTLALATWYKGTESSIHALLRNIMEEIRDHFRSRASRYLNEASLTLAVIAELSENGMLEHQSLESVAGFMTTIMERHPQFSALYFTSGDDLFRIDRMPDGTFSKRLVTRGPDGVATRWNHANPAWNAIFSDTDQPLAERPDPRLESWYLRAVERGDVTWSDAYVEAEGERPGITCSIPLYAPGTKELKHVVGINIRLDDLSYFLGQLSSKGLRAFVVNERRELIAFPLNPSDTAFRFQNERTAGATGGGAPWKPSSRLKTFSDLESDPSFRLLMDYEAAAQSAAAVPGGDPGDEATADGKFFIFKSAGESYLGLKYPLPPDTPWRWTLHIMVPERPYMAGIEKRLERAIAGSVLIVALSIIFGWFISNRITRPLAALSKDMAKIQRFELDDDPDLRSRIREVDDMGAVFGKMKAGLRSFSKYVPADLVRVLIRRGEEARIGGEKRELTVMFADIESFTTIAESLKPERLVARMAEYFTAMSETIDRNEGTVDKFIGDAVMAFWGAPEPCARHAELACKSALENSRQLIPIGEPVVNPAGHGAEPISAFRTRIGISTGEVIVGNMGSGRRLNYTAIGDSVNLASRLEGLNKVYGTAIVMSESTQTLVKDRFETRLLDYVIVKGKTRVVAIYELLGEKGTLTAEQSRFVAIYEDGLRLYRERSWPVAIERFEAARALRDEPAVRLFIDRCRAFTSSPPGPEWNGAFELSEK